MSPNSSQPPLFCTECYYKPGTCRNEPGTPIQHLGTPLPSSPPTGNQVLERINAAPPSNSLARSLAQHQEEMKYLNMEVMNKSLRSHEASLISPPKSTSLKHTEKSLSEKINLGSEFHMA